MNEPIDNPETAREAPETPDDALEPTAGAAEDIGNELSTKDSARLRRMADRLLWQAFTQQREK